MANRRTCHITVYCFSLENVVYYLHHNRIELRSCHKILKLTEGVSCFPFDYTICNFIINLFFVSVGLVLTVCLLISRAKQMIYFRNDMEN